MKSKLEEIYDREIEAASKGRSDTLRAWIAALSVGNGAALFGIFSVATSGKALPMIYDLVPSAWIFLLGLAAASVSSFAQVVCFRKSEDYWTWSDADRMLKDSQLPAEHEQEIIAADKAGDRWAGVSAYAAIASSIAFLTGVGWPLLRLTQLAIAGAL